MCSRSTAAGTTRVAMCVECWQREAKVALVPCGHKGFCYDCARKLGSCPVCLKLIENLLVVLAVPTRYDAAAVAKCVVCRDREADVALAPCGHKGILQRLRAQVVYVPDMHKADQGAVDGARCTINRVRGTHRRRTPVRVRALAARVRSGTALRVVVVMRA